MSLPFKIRNAYERLVSAFSDVVASANGGTVRSLPLPECFSVRDAHSVYVNYLHLSDWSFRPGKTKEKLNIIVKAEETVAHSHDGATPARYDVTKSTVSVSYYLAGFKKLLQSVHFDFEGPQQSHPVFHAQLTHEGVPVPAGIASQLGVLLPTQPERLPNCKTARIPTADMTLSSVLLCLTADHLKSEFVPAFLSELDKLEERLPLPRCDDFLASFDGLSVARRHLRSRHWFAHMIKP